MLNRRKALWSCAQQAGKGDAMTILVTGAAGHLGEAILRLLAAEGRAAAGLDIKASPFVRHVGSVGDRAFLAQAFDGVGAVIHSATLHKPHVATHTRQDFIDVNVSGTLALLEAARDAGVGAFVFISTTSVYGDAMAPPAGAPAVWVDEALKPEPKNIYGATKISAEQLVSLFARKFGLPALTLRMSRFFPEDDDEADIRAAYEQENARVNELLYRRVDIGDAARAAILAADKAAALSGETFIISAPTPFSRSEAADVARDLPSAAARHADFEKVYAARGWRMFPAIGRIYDSAKAVDRLGWRPKWTFASAVAAMKAGATPASALAAEVGAKGYHDRAFADGPFPVSEESHANRT
jgi:UDP-glucose 4-epimerase